MFRQLRKNWHQRVAVHWNLEHDENPVDALVVAVLDWLDLK
eukprot:05857.XXX_254099_254221_1 [CDS] Oithona nana genome sequencing.